MTVKELIAKLQNIKNQDAEIVLEDSILGLSVKLTSINENSTWEEGAIDLKGNILPNSTLWDNEDEDENED